MNRAATYFGPLAMDKATAEERLEEVRRAAISYRNCEIEAERYPHGKTLVSVKMERRRYERALWNARDEIEALVRAS